ncbi:MAG: hypothetical protein U5R31_15710 [Acidimicrobiia bacterium]|nr:hypothetical protein [Acidimicrobiia bacterium]
MPRELLPRSLELSSSSLLERDRVRDAVGMLRAAATKRGRVRRRSNDDLDPVAP